MAVGKEYTPVLTALPRFPAPIQLLLHCQKVALYRGLYAPMLYAWDTKPGNLRLGPQATYEPLYSRKLLETEHEMPSFLTIVVGAYLPKFLGVFQPISI